MRSIEQKYKKKKRGRMEKRRVFFSIFAFLTVFSASLTRNKKRKFFALKFSLPFFFEFEKQVRGVKLVRVCRKIFPF